MERKRLTITLKKDLLFKIDKVIDGEKIRNRSHAIEYLLLQTLQPKIKKAFILAAGKGLKMRPFTYEMPKTMIPVHGRPILEYTIELLRNYDIRNIIILIGYLGQKIKNYFGDGTKYGVKITYITEKKEVGTARPLLLAKRYLKEKSFLLIYGDILVDIDLADMISFHQEEKGIATVALTSVAEPSPYGVVKLRGNKILGFEEKPTRDLRLSRLISSGLFIMEPEIFEYVPKKPYSMLEKDVLPRLAKEGKLRGFPFEGQWFDVGTPEIYERVLKEWKK